ncbi:MAG: DUF1540 domain-containing protein [Defluviitaleaceae bacterium]|nr:DUF1540 domain-containing protein [Defluviitaleaceae bacterium]
MVNQNIKCGVVSCKFNENTQHCCTLDQITVGCDTTANQPHTKQETNCASFSCR